MSASIRGMDGKPLALPNEPGQTIQRPATFSHFAISALGSAYEGEDLTFETKMFRLELIEKINANVTAVNLNFVEKMLICQLVDRITKAPLIFKRFVEQFENVGIPTPVHVAAELPAVLQTTESVEELAQKVQQQMNDKPALDKAAEDPAPVV
jgi:hypothetical protein